MKYAMRLPFILFAIVLAVSGAQAQTRFGVSEADYLLAQQWLHTNCLAPEARSLVDALLNRRLEMQKAFAAALAEGPAADEIAVVEAAAAERWRTQQRFMDDPAVRNAFPGAQ